MNEVLKHKINRIVDYAIVSPWRNPIASPDLILWVAAYYTLIATNGKKCFASAFGAAVIDVEEQKQTHTQVEELKYHKICNAKKALKNLILSQFEKRTGLLAHKGYFKFVDIKEI